jgi:hypothetical protein
MEYDFNLLCYGLFKISKSKIILKVLLNIKIDFLNFLLGIKKNPYNILK